ncbi:hypothetical protein LZ554_004232 [Drepanopeziza brunnea f. sp. 'monogermtubi']|nr:hypothetical protein LZ554_004232 [Drepanopeziza brunnea f. sp. 'monogermtubi']
MAYINSQLNKNEVFEYDDPRKTAVNTKEKLVEFLRLIPSIPPSTPEVPQLALDCEGFMLGIYGTLDLIQIYVRSFDRTFVFDILDLTKIQALETESSEGWTLRRFLESPEHMQVWWDPRCDQQALFHLLGGITLPARSVLNLALIEIAVRDGGQERTYRSSLTNTIAAEGATWASIQDIDDWVGRNNAGRKYFKRHGYGVFHKRPLSEEAWQYAAGDVDMLMSLFDHFAPRQTAQTREIVEAVTERELEESMGEYPPPGSAKAPEELLQIPVTPLPPRPCEETVFTVETVHEPGVDPWAGDREWIKDLMSGKAPWRPVEAWEWDVPKRNACHHLGWSDSTPTEVA